MTIRIRHVKNLNEIYILKKKDGLYFKDNFNSLIIFVPIYILTINTNTYLLSFLVTYLVTDL